MFNYLKKYSNNYFLKSVSILPIIGLLFLNSSVLSQNLPRDRFTVTLSSQEQTDLEQGKVILKGEKGEYIAKVIATGDLENAWNVLTDYDNFQDFLPNISSSRIIKEDGNNVIFEQVNLVDLWLLTKQFTVQIAATKTELQKIDFKMLEGDLDNLQGRWEISKLPSNQILITHRVTVSPKSPSEAAFFYGIYESSLEETLQAIAVEIEKRSR